MPNHTRVLNLNGSTSLTFYCGELPADDAIAAAGHEPNGYFWEGMAQFLAPQLTEHVDLDSEAGMFSAVGDVGVLIQLQALLDPYLDDGARTATAIRDAEAAGFTFDD